MKRMILLLLAVLILSGCAASAEKNQPAPTEAVNVMATASQTEVPETEPAAVPEETEPATQPTETEPQPEHFYLTFTGDCTLGSNPHNYYADYGFIKTVGEDWAYPFANVIDWFENDDYTLINLEGTLCDSGNPVAKAHNFRGPCNYVNFLTENSVEAVTLANNHTMDYGRKGYESTVATLEAAGIPYVEENGTALFTTESGLTIGIYGTVYTTMNQKHMVEAISTLAQQEIDLIIYAPHWGYETSYQPHSTQIAFAHAAIDAGAHIVWGSHTHTLQPIEAYNGGIIYYSLGNFSFGGNIVPEDFETALIRQEVIREPDGTVRLGELTAVPCRISSMEERNNFQPTPYPENSEQYESVMKKLGLSR